MVDNRQWAKKVINRFDSSYRHRWELFDQYLEKLQNKDHTCLDIGCGESEELDLKYIFKYKTETDILFPSIKKKRLIPFIQSDLYYLPFRDSSFDLILLRFVIEHIAEPFEAFFEFGRILKKGGRILILTTNIYSPFIFLPKLLPYLFRKKLMLLLYKVTSEEIFPTYHYLNSRKAIAQLEPYFKVKDWIYIQDINWTRKGIFIMFFIWHLITKWLNLSFLRTNFLTILKKNIK